VESWKELSAEIRPGQLHHETWYAVALSSEVEAGCVIGREFLNGRVAIYRHGALPALGARVSDGGPGGALRVRGDLAPARPPRVVRPAALRWQSPPRVTGGAKSLGAPGAARIGLTRFPDDL